MDRLAVQEIANWVMKSRTPRAMAVQACQAMLQQFYCFGETEYMELREKMLMYWGNRREFLSLPSWREEDERMFDTTEFKQQNKLFVHLASLCVGN